MLGKSGAWRLGLGRRPDDVRLRLPDEAFDRIEHEYFETGHMPYLHEPSRKRELASIAAFVERR